MHRPGKASMAGIADYGSGEPVILELHLAEVQDSDQTIYESVSGAFTLFIDWDYVLTDEREPAEHIELHVHITDGAG
jgi:hypothetical protein